MPSPSVSAWATVIGAMAMANKEPRPLWKALYRAQAEQLLDEWFARIETACKAVMGK